MDTGQEGAPGEMTQDMQGQEPMMLQGQPPMQSQKTRWRKSWRCYRLNYSKYFKTPRYNKR